MQEPSLITEADSHPKCDERYFRERLAAMSDEAVINGMSEVVWACGNPHRFDAQRVALVAHCTWAEVLSRWADTLERLYELERQDD